MFHMEQIAKVVSLLSDFLSPKQVLTDLLTLY